MKLVRFPPGDAGDAALGPDPGGAIEAALNGETGGAEADELRRLQSDVRALAAPIDADFERELQARVTEWRAQRRGARGSREGRLGRRIAAPGKLPARAAGALAAVLVAVLIALVIVGSLPSGRKLSTSAPGEAAPVLTGRHAARPASSERAAAGPVGVAAPSKADKRGVKSADNAATSSPASGTTEASGVNGATGAPGRLQQLGASVSLATSSSGVQEAADGVTRLGVSDGGYVQSSHVQVHVGATSEATLTLSIPSARLSGAIAALGRIASVRAVEQESQDITESFDAERRRLGDDEAVRRALLRSLATAATQGQIDSLREQLEANRAAISRDRRSLHAVSQRAANSQLEVTIIGSGRSAAGSGEAREGLTLKRGLRDAAHVLAGAGAVLLIGLAVLLPLALVAFVLDVLGRGWRRRRREAALDA